MTCRHLPPTGDRGQRYEVRYVDVDDGETHVMGWTEREDGGMLAKGAELHPGWRDVVVVDRMEGLGCEDFDEAVIARALKAVVDATSYADCDSRDKHSGSYIQACRDVRAAIIEAMTEPEQVVPINQLDAAVDAALGDKP